MTARPPNPDSFGPLDAHARRMEGRRLIQACLDREIAADSPRLRALLSEDEQLRCEFDEFRRLDAILQQPSHGVDVSSKILAELQQRPVFLPARRQKRFSFTGFGVGLAASLALGAGTLWLTLAALRSPAPFQTIAQNDVIGEAREAIRSITGNSLASRSQRPYVIAPVSESSQLPDIESILSSSEADPRFLARQMAGAGSVRIERTGLSFVNPGPDRSTNSGKDRRTRAALLEWNNQPDAMYSGGKFRRSDIARASAVTGWYDKEGSFVPVTGAGLKNPK
ncbi:MAG: hypothetical protein KF805_06290 [Phycisphaeraceae bacterium]|nr:hypothetical protein [Phycisphaeraceae bacterium]